MKKLESLQALRGIAVLGVVAFHAMTIERKYSGGDQLLPGLLQLGQTGVDLFFVISGFVMVTVTRGRFGGRGETGRFLWSRFSRIYPTYWFYYALTAAVFLVRPGWVNAAQGHQVDLFASFLLLPGVHLPLVMVAWSLIHELWFYLAFAVLLQFRERLLPLMLLLWAAAVIAANTLLPPASPGPVYIIRHPFTLEFIAGAFAALLLYRQPPPPRDRRTVLLPALAVLPPALALVHHFNIVATMGLLRAATLGTLYALLVYAAASLESSAKRPLPEAVVGLGNISYTLYLSHILVLSAVGRLWRGAAPAAGSLVDNAVVLPAMLVAVVGCGWLAYRLVEQPALALSHRLRHRWFGRPVATGGDRAPRLEDHEALRQNMEKSL